MDDRITSLFVYGTLRPGQPLWEEVADFVDQTESAVITGWELFELPEGYPAIVPGSGKVIGDLLALDDGRVSEALRRTDLVESYRPGDSTSLYERIVIDTPLEQAHTYVYHPERRDYLHARGVRVESGDWLERVDTSSTTGGRL